MKNITLSADEQLIEAARQQAKAMHTTLNRQFRTWLENFVQHERKADDAMRLIEEIQGYARTQGKKFTREEMNER